MTEKRFIVENYSVRDTSIDTKYVNSTYHIGDKGIAQSLCDLLNELHEENKELKQEVELLREGLDAYDNNLPYYLTCSEVRDFNSDLFEFKIKQQQFYNEHPNLCKIIIDGVELK